MPPPPLPLNVILENAQVAELKAKAGQHGDSSNNLTPSAGSNDSGGGIGGFGSAQWKAMHMGSMRLKKMGAWIQ